MAHLKVTGLAVAALAGMALTTPSAVADEPICSVSGGGVIDKGDGFGGFASNRGGDPRGSWIHRTAGGDQLVATITTSMACRIDGGGPSDPPPGSESNRAFLSGTGTWNGASGFTFEARLADRGESGIDEYTALVLAPSGEVVHCTNGIVTQGNLQIVDGS